MILLRQLFALLRLLVASRVDIVLENVALRHQLRVLSRRGSRPRLRRLDRILWVWLSRLWHRWTDVLVIVQPETVVRWHRKGWRLYWRWKSRRKTGRPSIEREIRDLVRRMALENPLWGAPRTHGELLKLGFVVSETTVAKYMPRRDKPPSATWRAFLMNHRLVACDFFTVPTLTFGVLYVFVVIRHQDRCLLRMDVTRRPTCVWTAQQMRETFPFDEAPRYLLRDNDKIYGKVFTECVKSMGIKEVRIAWRSPWQNPYCERAIGLIRRECLDHMIALSAQHLRRVLKDYILYYNLSRTHLGLGKDSPEPRPVELTEKGARIVAIPQVGGLHHRYTRRAA